MDVKASAAQLPFGKCNIPQTFQTFMDIVN